MDDCKETINYLLTDATEKTLKAANELRGDIYGLSKKLGTETMLLLHSQALGIVDSINRLRESLNYLCLMFEEDRQ